MIAALTIELSAGSAKDLHLQISDFLDMLKCFSIPLASRVQELIDKANAPSSPDPVLLQLLKSNRVHGDVLLKRAEEHVRLLALKDQAGDKAKQTAVTLGAIYDNADATVETIAAALGDVEEFYIKFLEKMVPEEKAQLDSVIKDGLAMVSTKFANMAVSVSAQHLMDPGQAGDEAKRIMRTILKLGWNPKCFFSLILNGKGDSLEADAYW
jgi:hypothetical protein